MKALVPDALPDSAMCVSLESHSARKTTKIILFGFRLTFASLVRYLAPTLTFT